MARYAFGLLALALGVTARVGAQLRAVEVPITDRSGIDSLARLGFEVAAVRELRGELYAIVIADASGERALRGRGYVVTATVPPAVADTFLVYRSFDKPVAGIRATLSAWAAADTIFHLDSIGATIEGRPILAVKIGAADDSPGRPNVLFMATHHAREWVSTEMAMKLARWVADSLPRALLAQRDVWVIPVQNPDGYQYTFTADRLWRKNRRTNADGTFGVDPNRNYPAFWGRDDIGSSPTPGAETYRGPAPASELETQAIVSFHAAHPPAVAVSYHTYSGLVVHPYGYRSGSLPPDLPVLRALAGTDLAPAVSDRLPASTLTHYHPGPSWNLYPTNGEYTDWAYRAHGTIAFTTELTSGCCDPSSGAYYGFVFPDDSVLVEQVFRDNLQFAVSAIVAAGDLGNAIGASGLVVSPPRFEAVWPESWISLERNAAAPGPASVRTASGATVTRTFQSDSLTRGVFRTTWRADLRADEVRVVRAASAGLEAQLLSLGGAEPDDTGWAGWLTTADALAGQRAWLATGNDTLTSPVVDLRDRSHIWLQFWQKHAGSTFVPERRGEVQFSADSGRTWTDAAHVVGAGENWYPVRVDLPQASGVAGARVRFVARGFTWWLDAVGFATDSVVADQVVASAVADLELSQNPVRQGPVVMSWPASSQDARLRIYSFAGVLLAAETVTAPTSEFVWDGTAGGRQLPNGAYLVVVETGGRRYRARVFLAR